MQNDTHLCPWNSCTHESPSRQGLGRHFSSSHGEKLVDYERRNANGVKCPTCSLGGFKTEKGMKIHHAKQHDEKIGGADINCNYCNKTKHVDLYEAKKHDLHFCDIDCKSKWQSEYLVGENHPSWIDIEEKNCEYCQEKFRPQPHALNERRFCSQKCMGEWRRENNTFSGEKNPMWEGGKIELTCEMCGEIFRVDKHKRSQARFCSYECKYKWQTTLQENENPAWKGGKVKISCKNCDSNFETIRATADRRTFCSKNVRVSGNQKTKEEKIILFGQVVST